MTFGFFTLRRSALLAGTALVLAAGSALPSAPAYADTQPIGSQNLSLYEQAFRSFSAGDYRTARIQLLNLLREEPNNGLAHVLAARNALALGNGVEAQTELERAGSAGIPRTKYQHLLAHALLLQGERDKAEGILDDANFEPQFEAYAARLRGQVDVAAQDFEAAEREFNKALALAPDDPETVSVVSRFLLAVGQLDKARELTKNLLDERPGHVGLLNLMGDIVRRSEGLEAALPYFDRAIEVDRNNVQALLERAATLGDLGREDDARKDIQKVRALVPNHPMALYLQAVLETREGNTDAARKLMAETGGRVDSFAPALMLQGMLALDAGNVETASEYLGTLMGRVPNSITVRKLYATAQMQRGDAEGAINTLKPIIDANAADGRVYALMGAAMTRVGRTDEARAYLQKAEAAGGDPAVRNQLAMTELLEGNSDAAEQTVKRVLSEDKNSLAGLMMLALIKLQGGNFDEAEAAAKRITQAYPDEPIGDNLRGGALLGKGNRDGAEAAFRAALKKNANYAEARRNLAQVLIAKGEVREAKQQLREVVRGNNKDVRALMTLGELAGVEGDRKEQLGWLKQATSIDRDAAGPRTALAEAYLASGDTSSAQNEAGALLRDFPNDANAMLTAARIYEATDRQDQLVSIFNRMVSVEPNRILPRILLGRAQMSAGRADQARSTFERAVTITADDNTSAYLELIALEAREGRVDQAREWAIRLRKERPNSNVAEIAMARAYLLADRPQDALAPLKTARSKSFDLATARALADTYVALNRRGDAIKILQAYQKANPKDPGALGSIAELQLQAQQFRQAAANYEGLRKVVGNRDPRILNNLAYAYLELGDPRAVPIAKLAYDIAPRNASIADTYGWAILKTGGDKKQALNLLKRAASALPRNPEVRYHLAEAYAQNNQRSDAMKEVRAALSSKTSFAARNDAQALMRRLGG